MSKIFVLGSINRDLVAYVQNLPQSGETIFGHQFEQFPGGKGVNQAVAAKRLGGDVHFIGNVGNDAFGHAMLTFLQDEHVDTSAIQCLNDTPTGIALITVNEKAENTIIVISGANMVWPPESVTPYSFSPNDIVLSQFEIPTNVVEKAFATARQAGAITLLNPTPVQPLQNNLLHMTDYLIVNETELEAYAEIKVQADNISSVYRAAEKIRDKGVSTVVVTLGAHGVVASTTSGNHIIRGLPVHAIDSTGAGDCFIGAFAAQISQGVPLHDALGFANKAAAISVTRRGAASSLPTIADMNSTAISNRHAV